MNKYNILIGGIKMRILLKILIKILGALLVLFGIAGITAGDKLIGIILIICGVLCLFWKRKSRENKKIKSEESASKEGNINISYELPKHELTFRVKGVTQGNRQELIQELVDEWKELYPEDIYEGLSNKEILELGVDVYEANVYGYDEISLVSEPDNPEDPNAIKVIHRDAGMLGYVPKHLTAQVKEFLGNNCSIEWHVVGGKLKYIDWDEDKVKTKTLTYGIEITLRY